MNSRFILLSLALLFSFASPMPRGDSGGEGDNKIRQMKVKRVREKRELSWKEGEIEGGLDRDPGERVRRPIGDREDMEIGERRERKKRELGELGLFPGEIEAMRNILINVMDILDDGTEKKSKPKKCRKTDKKCKKKKQEEEEMKREGEEEEEEEESDEVVVIVVEDEEHDPTQLTLASLLYDAEAEWGPCTRSCKTQRFRRCLYPELCEEDEIWEEGLCYVHGSNCQEKVLSYLQDEGYVIIETTEDDYVDPDDPDYNPDYTYDYDNDNNYDLAFEYPDAENNVIGDYYDYGWADYIASRDEREEEAEEPTYYDNEEEEEEEEEEEVTKVGGCGRRVVRGREDLLRIIGGREATEGAWPWTAAVLNRFKEVFCGGTVIAPRWVLTAAHCLRKRLYVRLAEHDTREYSSQEVEMRVEASFAHPNYDEEVIESDIALLKLPREVDYGRYIQPACLPKAQTPPPARSKCVVAGWGKERESHIFGSDVLNYARVPIVTKAACVAAYPDHPLTKNHFCAGNTKGISDTCAGDSGGPLVCEDTSGVWTVHGVTSFGEGCGERGKFGVYTKVVNYLAWIKNTIKNN